jgi:hypothetical protein
MTNTQQAPKASKAPVYVQESDDEEDDEDDEEEEEEKPVIVDSPRSSEITVINGRVCYPREELEITPRFVLRRGENVLLKDNDFNLSTDDDDDDDDYSCNLVLTDQALIIIQTDGDDKTIKATRVPLCQISQCVYHKGFLDDKYIEIYREGAIDKFDVDLPLMKRLPLWELAINDRFDTNACGHDYNFYAHVNLKDLRRN